MQKLGNLLMFEPDVISCGSKKNALFVFFFPSRRYIFVLSFRFHRTVSLLSIPTMIYLVLIKISSYLTIITALQ